MPLPKALQGQRWTDVTARTILPLVIWFAKKGRTVTYQQLDEEIVNRGWGHHVMFPKYGYPAGAIGHALIETEEEWGDSIPPLNAIIVNKKNKMPGKGVDWFLSRYCMPEKYIEEMSLDERRAVVEEVQADVFAYEYWDDLLSEYGLEPFDGTLDLDEDDEVSAPARGGWSGEDESKEHRELKQYILNNPALLGLDDNAVVGVAEYLFSSSDRADVVFKEEVRFLAVEIKSIISNDCDLNRGLFQCVKYQALLRAEQKALKIPPTARSILVTERELPSSLSNLAAILGVKVVVCKVNV